MTHLIFVCNSNVKNGGGHSNRTLKQTVSKDKDKKTWDCMYKLHCKYLWGKNIEIKTILADIRERFPETVPKIMK